MRITGGKWARKQIKPPKSLPVRPTMDQSRESIFNILGHKFTVTDAQVLDLFAGTGIVSLEFASRGARHIDLVDSNTFVVSHLRSLSKHFSFSHNIFQNDVFSFLQNKHNVYDFIFADPPYNHSKIKILPELIFEHKLLNNSGIFILEHPQNIQIKTLNKMDERKYGQSIFSFFHA
ncbi:MAG: 16S rRNA (guanine(966)-N(2))-methyltransferase RsmD [Bacteroidetes bacterium MED-G17]|nr:MAG: 16S rRNA (guanine(966)-N(2))-methyltransferase RsmD [Bacteroidetes bacterium TMED39]PDH52082.1 MAG: 16S rRNA (guanine(966)-N(2))-methyltransferase RsmD [Bacteroidetes bacterium MED-G17]|tara:strand:- start:2137 stop:2664 length:528 start_codon:yes stop_codon:yes gene_type:complete